MKVIKENINEKLKVRRLDDSIQMNEEDSNMPKYHLVYTVDGNKSEQTISAVNIQKAMELIKSQFEGKNVNFISKQEVKESLKEDYEYVKKAFAFDIYKDGDNFVLLNGDGDEVYRSDNTLDCLKWAKKNSSKYYKANMSFDNKSWENDFLHEDLAALIQQLHDKDEYLWNLHNTDYEWLYDECSKYSDCWGSADCRDTIADCIRRMPKDAQYKLLDRLVAPLHESLNEDLEDAEKVIENEEKVPQTDEEVGLANMIIKEINGEWETISNYNDLISLMRTEGQDDMIDVISDIIDEENKHVGQLQKCLQIISPNVSEIDSGESEAKGQLNAEDQLIASAEECIDCADDDFGDNSGFEMYLV